MSSIVCLMHWRETSGSPQARFPFVVFVADHIFRGPIQFRGCKKGTRAWVLGTGTVFIFTIPSCIGPEDYLKAASA